MNEHSRATVSMSLRVLSRARAIALPTLARLLCAALVLPMALLAPAAAQEVIELPTEDRQLNPALDEVYRVGSALGEDWEQFGNVRRVAFDAAGQLYVFDNQ
ncbi:MAG: hypothetical protein OXH12_11950, partial [Chloroflexi bacterium]|nr:hypothetical protein [Chloroflexota bacterium]